MLVYVVECDKMCICKNKRQREYKPKRVVWWIRGLMRWYYLMSILIKISGNNIY